MIKHYAATQTKPKFSKSIWKIDVSVLSYFPVLNLGFGDSSFVCLSKCETSKKNAVSLLGGTCTKTRLLRSSVGFKHLNYLKTHVHLGCRILQSHMFINDCRSDQNYWMEFMEIMFWGTLAKHEPTDPLNTKPDLPWFTNKCLA